MSAFTYYILIKGLLASPASYLRGNQPNECQEFTHYISGGSVRPERLSWPSSHCVCPPVREKVKPADSAADVLSSRICGNELVQFRLQNTRKADARATKQSHRAVNLSLSVMHQLAFVTSVIYVYLCCIVLYQRSRPETRGLFSQQTVQ